LKIPEETGWSGKPSGCGQPVEDLGRAGWSGKSSGCSQPVEDPERA